MPRVGRPTKLEDTDGNSKEPHPNSDTHTLRISTGIMVFSSINTIRKETHVLTLYDSATAHNPLITKSYRAIRLRQRKAHRQGTVDHWKRIFWSDDSMFTLYCSNGKVQVQHLPGERLLPEFIVPTVKIGNYGLVLYFLVRTLGNRPNAENQ